MACFGDRAFAEKFCTWGRTFDYLKKIPMELFVGGGGRCSHLQLIDALRPINKHSSAQIMAFYESIYYQLNFSYISDNCSQVCP